MKRFAAAAAALLVLFGCSNGPSDDTGAPAITIKPKPPTVKLVDDYAVPVLMYHRIDDLTPDQAKSPLMRDLTVSPADFESQVAYLKENHFTALTIDQVQDALLNSRPLPERSVVITMDDGYSDS